MKLKDIFSDNFDLALGRIRATLRTKLSSDFKREIRRQRKRVLQRVLESYYLSKSRAESQPTKSSDWKCVQEDTSVGGNVKNRIAHSIHNVGVNSYACVLSDTFSFQWDIVWSGENLTLYNVSVKVCVLSSDLSNGIPFDQSFLNMVIIAQKAGHIKIWEANEVALWLNNILFLSFWCKACITKVAVWRERK